MGRQHCDLGRASRCRQVQLQGIRGRPLNCSSSAGSGSATRRDSHRARAHPASITSRVTAASVVQMATAEGRNDEAIVTS